MRQQQRTKTRQTKTVDQPADETTADRSKTDEVLESCDSCLSNIDDALEEQENREPTDAEIYAKGAPAYGDFYDPETGYDWDAYEKAREQYAKAYEAMTGMSWNPCTCG